MYIPTGQAGQQPGQRGDRGQQTRVTAARGGSGTGTPRTFREGTKRRVQRGAGTYEDLVMRGGRWISTGIGKTRQRLECERAGIPERYLGECVRLRTSGPGKPSRSMLDITQLMICIDMGVPVEQAEECRKALRSGSTPADIAQAIAEGKQPADVAKKSGLALYLGIGGVAIAGLVFFLKSRKKR